MRGSQSSGAGTVGMVAHWWEISLGRLPRAALTVKISLSPTWPITRAWVVLRPAAGVQTSRSTTVPGRA